MQLTGRALLALALCASTFAWVAPNHGRRSVERSLTSKLRSSVVANGSLHGENACFLPLKQLDQDEYTPRIVQIAGAYPGLTRDEFMAVTSEPAAVEGQWTYDFSDPEGPQLGTVAVEGSLIVAQVEDPVIIIAEHFSIGVDLPKAITEAVDLIVLVDRAKSTFAERKFLVIEIPGQGLKIQAFSLKSDIPQGSEILGQVEQVQIPWLPSMESTKSGFLEADEYY
jgi:hypothetical protein